jgi:hypothetical protein
MKPGVWYEANGKRGSRAVGVSVKMTTSEGKALLGGVGRFLRRLLGRVDRPVRGKCLSPSKPPPEQS